MSVTMKARKSFVYAGHRINAGSTFEARNTDVRLLAAIGNAERAALAVVAQPKPYKTRVMTAAATVLPEVVIEVHLDSPQTVDAMETAAPQEEEVKEEAVVDDLDAMEKNDLHTLAADLGLKLHHMTGAEKVRQAIRAFRESGEQ